MEQRKCENTDGTKQTREGNRLNMTSSLERLKIIN
ncbi:hypothetical protein T05_5282 [Trichinella murrelli]|uniref:Uncharacterized protein n=1 Tax=Trichinella murrelli TaxID=144512 RepID=A0A0V0SUR8_9BILA|nr:hypothetical protein T05_5282 [Trichinella murrelli]